MPRSAFLLAAAAACVGGFRAPSPLSLRRAPLRAAADAAAAPPRAMGWLKETGADEALLAVSAAVLMSFAATSEALRSAECDSVSCFGSADRDAMSVAVLASDVLLQNLELSGGAAVAAVTDNPVETDIGGRGYAVAACPYDGSGVLDVNGAVGSSVAVWPGKSMYGATGRRLAMAAACVYGPRTTAYLGTAGRCAEFLLGADGRWSLTAEHANLSPSAARLASFDTASVSEAFRPLADAWLGAGVQVRHSGSVVPDVMQILGKGGGVYVAEDVMLAFQAIPLAALLEVAGGSASDGVEPILDKKVGSPEETTAFAAGSRESVEHYERVVGDGAGWV